MARLVTSLILAILLLIFTSQNMHMVTIRLIFGSPVELPMILAIAGAFVAGFVVATLGHIVWTSGKRKSRLEDDDL